MIVADTEQHTIAEMEQDTGVTFRRFSQEYDIGFPFIFRLLYRHGEEFTGIFPGDAVMQGGVAGTAIANSSASS
ncbi:hypothetical protein [Chitinophaga sp. sic0106]|uniref:hypothetical protein n=1 Tax=Chitinophaga sp. sic0106 TaxID=2854785 RepID=UPI001C497442|nr:hypothetical protein [Chitinophaga sp. sic0106]MBV7532963.1 hypothetical protein [Chitinophaga sp. sic0106]